MLNEKKELEIGGISFGLTSGVITTVGMIVGIDSATGSKLAIVAAILTIAIADSLSDALGIHLSEESRKDETKKPIWTISIYTFLGKLIFSLIFLIPFSLLSTAMAVRVSIVVGLLLIGLLAVTVSKRKHHPVGKELLEHGGMAILVIIASYLVGRLADNWK